MPLEAFIALASAITQLLNTWAQNELLITQSLPPDQRQKWAQDQIAMRQPWVDLLKAIAAKIG